MWVLYLWLVLLHLWLFVLGAAVGSFLNVCIYRLAAGKPLSWPGSRCGSCFTPIPPRENVPVLGYWILGGRCPRCGAAFSMRYFLVELATALVFVALYASEVAGNSQGYPSWGLSTWHDLAYLRFPDGSWYLFGAHALLACLLIVAAGTLLDTGRVPQSVPVFGALCGFVWSLNWPWPEPGNAAHLYWGKPPPGFVPLPGLPFLQPGSLLMGLATALMGLLVVPWLLRLVDGLHVLLKGRAVFGQGAVAVALIAGGFLGWQVCLVALAAGAVCAAPVVLMTRRGDVLPLSFLMALILVWLGWGQSLHEGLAGPLLSWGGPVLLGATGLLLFLIGLPATSQGERQAESTA